jgi:hypothetical protein
MNLKNKKGEKKEQTKTAKKGAVVSEVVGNYEKHPFFVKKALAAKELLLKVGLPKQMAKKVHS